MPATRGWCDLVLHMQIAAVTLNTHQMPCSSGNLEVTEGERGAHKLAKTAGVRIASQLTSKTQPTSHCKSAQTMCDWWQVDKITCSYLNILLSGTLAYEDIQTKWKGQRAAQET